MREVTSCLYLKPGELLFRLEAVEDVHLAIEVHFTQLGPRSLSRKPQLQQERLLASVLQNGTYPSGTKFHTDLRISSLQRYRETSSATQRKFHETVIEGFTAPNVSQESVEDLISRTIFKKSTGMECSRKFLRSCICRTQDSKDLWN